MSRADFRLPEDLKRQVMAAAEAQGIDFSEYVRQTLAVRLAWEAAVHASMAGVDPKALLDPQRVQAAFRIIAEGNDERPDT